MPFYIAQASDASEVYSYSPENIYPHLLHMLVTTELAHILHNDYSNALAIYCVSTSYNLLRDQKKQTSAPKSRIELWYICQIGSHENV